MARGEGLSGYYRFLSHFGEYIWLQTRATLMYDSRTGQPSYIVCMNFIISKEDGDKDLELQQAITDGGSNIKSDGDHTHDPFPLSEREDGKAVNPLRGRDDLELPSTDDSPRHSQEEPSSTVELNSATKEEVSPVTADCVSPDSGDLNSSETSDIPSIMVSSETVKSSRLHSNVSDDSPPVISSHKDDSPSSMTGSTVSSSSSSPMSHTTPRDPNSNPQAMNSNSKAGNGCQPDSTTSSALRSASEHDTQKKKDANFNRRLVSDDVGYHSETSCGARQMASVGNESEVSGSSCAHRNSPESSMFTAFSPDYPQSVFSSDNSLPPPSNRGATHTDSSACDSQYTLHHPGSHISHSMAPTPPETRVYDLSSVNQHGFRGSLPQQFISGQPNQQLGDRFFISGVVMDSQPRPPHLGQMRLNSGSGHYSDSCHGGACCCSSSFPHCSVGGGGGFMGGAPANVHPNRNANGSSSISFMKEEPSSPPYASPYIGNVPSQGATGMFSTTGIWEEQSRLPPPMPSCHHQPQYHSTVFPSQPTVFTGSVATSIQGDPPGYQFTHFSSQASTAFTSDLPHLTGEDLKMLDAFSEQVRGEEGQFVQLRSQQATLNYNGAGMMLQ